MNQDNFHNSKEAVKKRILNEVKGCSTNNQYEPLNDELMYGEQQQTEHQGRFYKESQEKSKKAKTPNQLNKGLRQSS